MFTAIRQQQNCHLVTRNIISRILENNLESYFFTQHKQLLSYTALCLNPFSQQYSQKNNPWLSQKKYCHGQKQIKLRVNFKRPSLPDSKEGSYGSRFHPPSQIEIAEEKIKECLISKSLLTSDEWREVKTDLMDDVAVLSEVNFSSIIMNCLLTLNKVNEAHALLAYLKEANISVNFLAHLKYMDLCARNIDQCGQDVIISSFEKVRPFLDGLPLLDFKGTEHLIQGLCVTDKWRLSLGYVKKIAHKPNMVMKNCIACAAIRNSDEALAWEIIKKWMRKEEHPSNRVFKEFFLYALRLGLKNPFGSELFVVNVFKYMQQKCCIVNEEVSKLIEEYFRWHSSKWNISYTKVNRNGDCESCMRSLQVIDFTDDDFTHLKNSFLERSVKKADLFINTTEKEFDQYIHFVNAHKPFDIVLDGLNAAHTFQGQKNPKKLALNLLKVVESLSGSSNRLLVLGKHHMRSWPGYIMKKISQRAKLFLTSNISQDDPFMIYAALLSGPHANILSGDLMRDHMSRLEDPKLIWLFKRWQQTHQIFLTVDDDNDLHYMNPLRHSINIHGDMKEGWHIPFDDGIALEPYEALNNWLCIKK